MLNVCNAKYTIMLKFSISFLEGGWEKVPAGNIVRSFVCLFLKKVRRLNHKDFFITTSFIAISKEGVVVNVCRREALKKVFDSTGLIM